MSFDILSLCFFKNRVYKDKSLLKKKNRVYLGFHNDGEDMVTGVWSMVLSGHISSHLQEVESGSWEGQGCQPQKIYPRRCIPSSKGLPPKATITVANYHTSWEPSVQICNLWAVFIIPTMRYFMHCFFSIFKRKKRI